MMEVHAGFFVISDACLNEIRPELAAFALRTRVVNAMPKATKDSIKWGQAKGVKL